MIWLQVIAAVVVIFYAVVGIIVTFSVWWREREARINIWIGKNKRLVISFIEPRKPHRWKRRRLYWYTIKKKRIIK